MDNYLSRKILLSILAIALVIIAVVGVSYAYLITGSSGGRVNVLDTGSISLDFIDGENNINLTNMMPISDSDGMVLNGEGDLYDFSVSSTLNEGSHINYEIAGERVINQECQQLDDNDIKIYLEKLVGGKYKAVPITVVPRNFMPNRIISDMGSSPDMMRLHIDSFVNTSDRKMHFTDRYRLRMWLSKDAVIDDVSRCFQMKIRVYGKVL